MLSLGRRDANHDPIISGRKLAAVSAVITKYYDLHTAWLEEGDHLIRQFCLAVKTAKRAQRRVLVTRPRILLTYVLRTDYAQREDDIAKCVFRSRTSVIRMLNAAEFDVQNDPAFVKDLKAVRKAIGLL